MVAGIARHKPTRTWSSGSTGGRSMCARFRSPARNRSQPSPPPSRRSTQAFRDSSLCFVRTSSMRPFVWSLPDTDVLRRVQAPAARHRPPGNGGVARLPRAGRRGRGREPCPLPHVQAAQAREAAARRPAAADPDPLHQHDQPGAGAFLPRRRTAGASHPPHHPLERGGDGPPVEQPVPGHRRPPVHVRVLSVAL